MQQHKPGQLSEILASSILIAGQKGLPAHQVKLLLSDITGISVPALTLSSDYILSGKQSAQFDYYLRRLLQGEPLQYIIGKAYFFALELLVNEAVLIPRPETEGLVDWICSRVKGRQTVLDIGTGSGAIALALKHLNPAFRITATDISANAVKLARKNASRLGLAVKFEVADLFPKAKNTFDIIVSNPPYISKTDYEKLDAVVRCNEPKPALYAGRDGLHFYRCILSNAGRYLQESGKIYLEIGETQGNKIKDIASEHGFTGFELRQDLAGRDRYLCITG